MQFTEITSQRDLLKLCDEFAHAPSIAFDTEFVSEDRYRPDLCLIQVAIGQRVFVLDTQRIEDAAPFWSALAEPGHQTIVHAGREEMLFSLRAVNRMPHNLFDVQIAAALVGLEYPAAYSTLVSRLLNQSLGKGETRTDWRRRPLSPRQIEYALRDVVYLEPLRDALDQRLRELNRHAWFASEMQSWQDELEQAESREAWRRVSGTSGLSARQLAIVRELWRWRDQEAARRDKPVRHVLRDDLIVELSRRQTAELRRIRAVRGLERRDIQRHHRALADCIQRALSLPDNELPERPSRSPTAQLNLLGQFLNTALSSICRGADVAPSMVGSAQDVRELIAYRLDLEGAASGPPPSLARGWRAEIVGKKIEQLLEGRLSIRITDPLSDHPLTFEDSDGQPPPDA